MFGNVAYSQAPFDSFAGTTYLVDVSELAVAQETQATRGLVNSSASELATASDVVAGRLPISVSVITEAATAADGDVATIALIRGVILESAIGADSILTKGLLYASRSEQIVAAETVLAQPNYAVRRQEAALATDQPAARRLWEPVPDEQDANWVIIPTTPTS